MITALLVTQQRGKDDMRATSKKIGASITLVAGMSAGLVNYSHADAMATGNDLLKLCKKQEYTCTWFMLGVGEGILIGQITTSELVNIPLSFLQRCNHQGVRETVWPGVDFHLQ